MYEYRITPHLCILDIGIVVRLFILSPRFPVALL